MIRIKRAYAPASPEDGLRVLVERLWPRGISKEKAKLDRWLKEVSPSPELRKWFGHDPAKWDKFAKRYRAELQAVDEPLNWLRRQAARRTVTLIYGARDTEHNGAVVLKAVLERGRR